METIEFWKMSGSGNDFILIDNRDGRVKDEDMGRIVERACRRRESVGADGVIFVVGSDHHDFGWHYFNADGGEVEMCGNGGRCVSRFAYLKGIAGPEMTFETLAGPVSAVVRGRMVKVLMPKPTGLSMVPNQFEPCPISFLLPSTVTVHYADEDLIGIGDESSLGLYLWEGSWQDAANTCDPASTYSRDLAGNALSLPICHLTEFSIQGE